MKRYLPPWPSSLTPANCRPLGMGVPHLSLSRARDRLLKAQKASPIKKAGVASRNVYENKGTCGLEAFGEPGMYMKTKGIVANNQECYR